MNILELISVYNRRVGDITPENGGICRPKVAPYWTGDAARGGNKVCPLGDEDLLAGKPTEALSFANSLLVKSLYSRIIAASFELKVAGG